MGVTQIRVIGALYVAAGSRGWLLGLIIFDLSAASNAVSYSLLLETRFAFALRTPGFPYLPGNCFSLAFAGVCAGS